MRWSRLSDYLLLAGLRHGKLVNLRPPEVEHEFVNASLTKAARTCFEVIDSRWRPSPGFGVDHKILVEEMVRDWGAGLSRSLYEEGVIHFCGGLIDVITPVEVRLDGTTIGRQDMALCDQCTILKITTFDRMKEAYRRELERFLVCTELTAVQWINISLNSLSFDTIRRTSKWKKG